MDNIFDVVAHAAYANPAPAKPTIWVAYYSDMSACGLFTTEVEALRHAVEHSMPKVKKVVLPVPDLLGSLWEA